MINMSKDLVEKLDKMYNQQILTELETIQRDQMEF